MKKTILLKAFTIVTMLGLLAGNMHVSAASDTSVNKKALDTETSTEYYLEESEVSEQNEINPADADEENSSWMPAGYSNIEEESSEGSAESSDVPENTEVVEAEESLVAESSTPEGASVPAEVKKPRITPFALPADTLTMTSVVMTIGGAPVDPDVSIPRNSEVVLTYEWEIPDDKAIILNDTYEFQLTPAFSAGAGFDDGVIVDPDTSLPIGTLTLSGTGLATVTFTDQTFIDSQSRSGGFEFILHFSDEVQDGPGRQEIDLGFGESQEIWLDGGAGLVLMDKTGSTVVSNDRLVKWTIDVNLDYTKIDGATVTDDIPSGLYVTAVNVYELAVDGAGARTQGVEITDFTAPLNVAPFVLNFNNQIEKPYRIIIETTVNEDVYDATFENTATFSGTKAIGGEAVSVNGISTVTYFREKLEPIAKDGVYDPTEPLIEWTVRYNYGKTTMTPVINDMLVSGFEDPDTGDWTYDIDSFHVFLVTPTGAATETVIRELDASEFSVVMPADKTMFTLTIAGGVPNTDAYRIHYKTPVDSLVHIQENGTLVNRVETNGFDASDGVDYWPYSPGAGIAKAGVLDPNNHEIHWTIKFNHSGFDLHLTNVVIKDTIPDGQGIYELDYAGIVVTNLNTNVPLSDSLYIVFPESSPLGFRIEFSIPLDAAYKVEFTTKYDIKLANQPFPGKFLNKAGLDYGGKDPSHDLDVTAAVPAGDVISGQGQKSGTYNLANKTINWQTFINYNSQLVENAVLTDTLGPDHSLVAGSIKVHNLNYAANGTATLGAEITTGFLLNVVDDRTFTITFTAPLTHGVGIAYSSVPDGVIRTDGIYTNQANLAAEQAGEEYLGAWNAAVEIPDAQKYSGKTGEQHGAFIDWTAKINPNQSVIPNPEIHDRLSFKQQYVRGTFHLYNAHYVGSTLTKGAELAEGVDYSLVILTPTETEGEGFIIQFIGSYATIQNAFILDYQQKIVKDGTNNPVVRNNIKMIGVEIIDDGGSIGVTVDYSAGSGTGSGDFEELKISVTVGGIVWIDLLGTGIREEHDPGIKGVVLYLTDKDGRPVKDVYGNIVKPVITGITGRYLFEFLPALLPGEEYVTHIDRAASFEALKPFVTTIPGQGDDVHDSANWEDRTSVPKNVGDRYLHLDYGFVYAPPVVPPVDPPVVPPVIPPVTPPVVTPPVVRPPNPGNPDITPGLPDVPLVPAKPGTNGNAVGDGGTATKPAFDANYNPSTGGGPVKPRMGAFDQFIVASGVLAGAVILSAVVIVLRGIRKDETEEEN